MLQGDWLFIYSLYQVEEFKSRNLQLGKELEDQQVKLSRVKKLNDKAATEVRKKRADNSVSWLIQQKKQ